MGLRPQITAVDAHALNLPRRLGCLELARQLCDPVCGPFRVVGINEHCRAAAAHRDKVAQRLLLAVVCLNEGVRHRARQGNAKLPTRFDRRGCIETGQVSRSRRIKGGLLTVRAAHAEVNQTLAARGTHAPHGLAGDHRLKVNQVQKTALDELGFQNRRGNTHNRFIGEEWCALRHRMQGAGESHRGEVIQKR